MNINNWSGKRKVLAIFAGILGVLGIIVTILLVQLQQETRGRAEKATVLSLAPPNQDVDPGGEATLNVVVSPGTNQVNFVNFTIKFDPQRFSADENSFSLEEGLGLQIVGGPVINDGELAVSVSIGSDPTKVIKTTQKIGLIKFFVKESAPGGASQVSFDESKTQVRSTSGTDAFNENVLSSTVPATITITALCQPNIGTCSWDPSEAAASYRFKITDVDSSEVISEGSVDVSQNKIEFTAEPGKSYKCEVVAVNECGETDPSEATSECAAPSATPTPAPRETPTPTPTPEPTPEPTFTPTPEPTVPASTSTPTPTTPQGGIETPTPTTEVGGIETPTPTLPPPGSPVVVGGIIGGILFIIGGLALLFL